MKKRAVSALTAVVMVASLAVTGLTGCGSSDSDKESVRLMVWSPQGDQSKDKGEWLRHAVMHLPRNIRNGISHLSTVWQMRQVRQDRSRRMQRRVQTYSFMLMTI